MEIATWRVISKCLKKIKFEFESIKRSTSVQTISQKKEELQHIFIHVLYQIDCLESLKNSPPAEPELISELHDLQTTYVATMKEIDETVKRKEAKIKISKLLEAYPN